jgi:hypothetical protein
VQGLKAICSQQHSHWLLLPMMIYICFSNMY